MSLDSDPKIIIRDDYEQINIDTTREIQNIKEHIGKIYDSLNILTNIRINEMTYNSRELSEVHLQLKNIENRLFFICESISSQKSELQELQNGFSHLLKSQEAILENTQKILDRIIHKDKLGEVLSKSKDEYTSALQCEMEISRQHLIRELRRSNFPIKSGHGDPLYG